ncbi:hypothetical protein IJS77_01785 [bacterium]|nr:hypothetical protein [bacterium]
MNDYVQNKQIVLKELESLISGNKNYQVDEENENMIIYCNYMKCFYLSCSTNN